MGDRTFVFCSCRGLRPHGGAHKDSVLPVEGFINQRDSWKDNRRIIFSAGHCSMRHGSQRMRVCQV